MYGIVHKGRRTLGFRSDLGARVLPGEEPPLFVDVRASRKVRAVGFREGVFEKRFGPERYRWLPRLGNEAIVKGTQKTKLIDSGAAADLLELAGVV